MIRFGTKFLIGTAVILGSATLMTSEASAQATRTWVSGVGDDANPCSRTAPCKTFAGTISKTAAGGEINCIDPGGFGAVTITKSISIICEDVEAGILVSAGNAINIVAGVNDTVIIKGLDIEGFGSAINGIRITQAGTVEIYETSIADFRGGNSSGILFSPTNNARLLVDGVALSANGAVGDGGGITVATQAGGQASVVIQDTSISGSGNIGVSVAPATTGATINKVQVLRTTITGGIDGVTVAGGASNSKSQVLVSESTITNNSGAGITSDFGGAKVWIVGNKISNNNDGLKITGTGIIQSFGRNDVFSNVNSATPTTTIPEI